MKKLTKVVISAAAGLMLSGSAAVFAQESLTSESTFGVFGTDVDDYMDVNSWSNVNPKKAFVFADFYDDHLSAGFSKQGKKVYFGTYFDGAIASFNSFHNDDPKVDAFAFGMDDSEISDATAQTLAQSTGAFDSASDSSFTADFLLGIENMGFKFSFDLAPKTFWYKTKDYEYREDKYTLTPAFGWGLNTKDVNWHAGLGMTFKPWVINNDGHKTKQSSPNTLSLAVGFDYDFDKKGPITQSFGLDLYDDIWIYVDKKSNTTEETDNEFYLVPAYSLTYEPSKSRGAAGLSISLPLNITASASDDDGKYRTTIFSATPVIAGAIKYQLIKEKLTFNSGVQLDLGAMTITGYDMDGDKSSSFSVFDTYSMGMNAGLTWNFSEHLTIDTLMNVFTPNASGRYGTSAYSIWNNNFGIQVSVKF